VIATCLVGALLVLGCAEVQRFGPALAHIPAADFGAVRVLEYEALRVSGMYYPAERRVVIGGWATDRDLWHEWGHALFVGHRDGYPTQGGLTTVYGATSPDEDVAECYAELLDGTRQCDGGRLGWIERHSGAAVGGRA
jgi:hypothetical protein